MAYTYTAKRVKESINVSWKSVLEKLNKIWKKFEIFLKISILFKVFFEKPH